MITFTDISTHKESENKLTELNIELLQSLSVTEAILTAIEFPLVVLNRELIIIKANGAFCQKFRNTSSNIIGQSIFNLDFKWNQMDFKKFIENCVDKIDGYMEYQESLTSNKKWIIKGRSIHYNGNTNQLLILIFQEG